MSEHVTLDEVWRLFKETDAMFKETAARLGQLEETVARTSRNVDAITDKWGRFVEGIVAPAAKSIFRKRGIPVHEVAPRVEGERDGIAMEIDLLVTNDDAVVAIEVKSTVRVADVDEHLERLANFKKVFRRHGDARVYGAIAGIDLPPDVARYAYRKGLFVLAQSGDTMIILNDDGFVPKAW